MAQHLPAPRQPRIPRDARAHLLSLRELVRPFVTWTWVREHLPLINSKSVRRRAAVVLPPYKRKYTLHGALLPLIALPMLCLGCLIYGFFFGLTAPYLLVPFAAPIALLILVSIWALPDQRSAPTLGIEVCFLIYFLCLGMWPDYLAIHLPGMPWITPLRMVGIPMAGLLLISLSVSPSFYRAFVQSVTEIKPLWYALASFWILELISIGFSSSPGSSANGVFTSFISVNCVFFISCMIFRRIEFVERYYAVLCLMVIPIAIITVLEFRIQHCVWRDYLPPFLRNPGDPTFRIAMQPIFRPGTNVYRAKSIFKTSLILAEYLGMMTPFLLYFATTKRALAIRLAALAMVPLCFISIRMTDARLGLVAMLVSVLLYGLAVAFREWRSRPQNLLSTAVLFASPVAFMGALGAVLVSHQLNMMVFGGEAQAGSNAARAEQINMALARIATHPWGFGPGQSGMAMGYAQSDFITIDNYFISMVLDYGPIGTLLWYFSFAMGIYCAVRYSFDRKYIRAREAEMLVPLGIGLCAFLVVKWVHGQGELHAIEYMMLGMISALVLRLRARQSVTPK